MSSNYPQVISKVDPLIIRVNDLMLLVGSTSYSAKIKVSSVFSGFYIYTSSIGDPIEQITVDVGSRSTIASSGAISDAHRYIASKASEWIDSLQQSFTNAKSQKNTVELLKELKCQIHYDNTGDNTLYEAGMDVNMSSVPISKHMTDIYTEFTNINNKLDALNTRLEETITGIDTLSKKSEAIANRLANSNTTLGDMVSDAVSTALESMLGQFNDIKTFLETSVGSLPADNASLHTYIRSVNSVIDDIYSSVGVAETSNTNSSIQSYLRNVIRPDVSNTLNTLSNGGAIFNTVSSINQSVGTSPDGANVHSYLRTINTNIDDESNSIRTAMGGIGQGNASSNEVSAVKGVVDSINSTVRSLSISNLNRVANKFCDADVVDVLWDAVKPINDEGGSRVSGYVQTEVTRDEYLSS